MTSSPSISRRQVVTGAAAAALALGTNISARAKETLSFLAVGDWGSGNGLQRRVAEAMAAVARASHCSFVISTGDNFYPKGVAGAKDDKFRSHFEEPYAAAGLDLPWRVTLGNHDHSGNAQAQIDYSAINPRWYLPANYYKRSEKLADGTEADFFFLDTDPIQRQYEHWTRFVHFPAREQVAWLERELAASTAPWKIVVGHHPLFSGGHHGNTDALISLLQPLFDRYGVRVYLNGHDHDLQHMVVGEVHYLTSGGGSDPRRVRRVDGTRFAAGRAGFLGASLSTHEMSVEFFDDRALSLYRAAIPLGM